MSAFFTVNCYGAMLASTELTYLLKKLDMELKKLICAVLVGSHVSTIPLELRAQESVSLDTMLMRANRPSLQICPQCLEQPKLEYVGKSSKPTVLSDGSASTEINNDLKARLIALKSDPAVISLVVAQNRSILFQAFNHGITHQTQLLSLSMAKPLISLLVGTAVCKGVIKSLDDKSQSYTGALAGTAYGSASIRSLLLMSSGADRGSGLMGETTAGETGRWAFGVGSQFDTLKVRSGYNKRLFGQDKEGDWYYKNLDVYALSLVLRDSHMESVASLTQRYLWESIGAEDNAVWVLDKNKDPIVSSFFAASAFDWIRVANFIIETVNGKTSDSCFENYMKEATVSKQTVSDDLGFTGYGYLFRLNYSSDRSKSIVWFRGAFGQLMGIHPSTGRVLIVQATHARTISPAAEIFSQWVNN